MDVRVIILLLDDEVRSGSVDERSHTSLCK
jgi:hypothetical protein